MARSTGLDLQAAVSGHLKNMGFKIQEEEEWDHNNKIDFVITKFPKYPKMMSIGVQVTTRCSDDAKRGEFVAKNDPDGGSITVATKALYLEIEENVDINKGGAELVASVVYAFQFDDQFANTKIWAATVQAKSDSIGYRFFDPRRASQATPSSLTKPTAASERIPLADLVNSAEKLNRVIRSGVMEMEGTIHSYFTEGRYGFISAQDGGTYYMHFNDLRDQHLRDSLDALMRLPGKTSVDFPVLFVDGGKTKSDAAYKAAKNVRLLV